MKKFIQLGISALSMLVLFVGTSSIKLPSVAFYYQPEIPEALRQDK